VIIGYDVCATADAAKRATANTERRMRMGGVRWGRRIAAGQVLALYRGDGAASKENRMTASLRVRAPVLAGVEKGAVRRGTVSAPEGRQNVARGDSPWSGTAPLGGI
jgi:hypothetical protein